jgi:LysR family transcriptional regulator, low CO2-responsive transcriptional regulator
MPRSALRRYFRHGLLPQLLVFEAVARLGGVTRAADALHLAQPTVSTQLRKLSDALGVALFEPRGRGLELTAAGRELRLVCEEMTQLLTRTEARLAPFRAPKPEVLRLASAPGARQLAARLLAAFCMRYPGVQASLHVANRARLLERMDAGEDDLYLISARDDTACAFHAIASEPLHVYAPPGHALLGASAITLTDLAREAFVLREPGSSTREALLAACAAHGVRLSARVDAASDEAVAEAVAGGVGLALLPASVAAGFVRTGAIAALDVRGFPIERVWGLAHAGARRLPPQAVLFLREAPSQIAEPMPSVCA